MKQREIDCIARLFHINPQMDEMLEFMLQEHIIDAEELPFIKREVDKPKYIYFALNKAKAKGLIHLLDFEWTLLPVERIKITLVTNSATKEFGHAL